MDQTTTSQGFNTTQQCRYGQMIFNRHDWAIGRHLSSFGEWAQSEMNLMMPFLAPGYVAIDAGANIGAHTLFFAHMVGTEGHVHSFEPQRIIFQMLCGNVALNSLTQVTCHNVGLGNAHKTMSISPVDYSTTNNSGMAKLGNLNEFEELVPVKPLDSIPLRRCDVIKADVERMEKELLEGAYRTICAFRPVLYLENYYPEYSQALLEYVWAMNYQVYEHKAPVFNPDNFFGNPVDQDNGYVEANILCVPREKLHLYDFNSQLPIL